MQRRLPPLNALRAFEAAARLGSFSHAADELNVTHGAVSRHVQVLEDWLGTKMFRRLNRRVMLTAAGQAYLAEVGAAFDRIAVATAQHAAVRGRSRLLRINATATLTLRWLIPRLSGFQRANPAIEVRLTTSNDPIETLGEAHDLAIRRREGEVAGYVMVAAIPEYRIPVCSPKLLERTALRSVEDLRHHTLLHTVSQPHVWSDWLKAAGAADLVPLQSLVLEHNYQALQGALNGLGVANGSSGLIADELASGRLVAPLPGPKLPGEGYRAYVPATRIKDPSIQAFYHWLQQAAAGPEEM